VYFSAASIMLQQGPQANKLSLVTKHELARSQGSGKGTYTELLWSKLI
jgi:hypothetical protein